MSAVGIPPRFDPLPGVRRIEGGSSLLSNLRLLCRSCHARETRELAGRRAAARRPERPARRPRFEQPGLFGGTTGADAGPSSRGEAVSL